MKTHLALLTLLLSPQCFGQLVSDEGLSPKEKESSGFKLRGIYIATDGLHCSPKSIQNKIGNGLLSETSVTFDPQDISKIYFVRELNIDLQKSLSTAFAFLNDEKDPIMNTKHLCVGFYNYAELNARSYQDGYIFVDPIAFFTIRAVRNHSMLSTEMVYMHELAHQFQYWHGDEFANDLNVRRKELVADCAGAALTYLIKQKQWGTQIMSVEEPGLRAAAQRVGDINIHHATHHGTPTERALAADHGINWAKIEVSIRLIHKLPVSSQRILESCQSIVRNKF